MGRKSKKDTNPKKKAKVADKIEETAAASPAVMATDKDNSKGTSKETAASDPPVVEGAAKDSAVTKEKGDDTLILSPEELNFIKQLRDNDKDAKKGGQSKIKSMKKMRSRPRRSPPMRWFLLPLRL